MKIICVETLLLKDLKKNSIQYIFKIIILYFENYKWFGTPFFLYKKNQNLDTIIKNYENFTKTTQFLVIISIYFLVLKRRLWLYYRILVTLIRITTLRCGEISSIHTNSLQFYEQQNSPIT